MKKTIIFIAALAFVAWGCSSEKETVEEQKVLLAGTDTSPLWQVPNYDLYEQTMSVEVALQDTLVPYASANDLMCATVNNEVRGVASPIVVNGQWLFQLMVGNNDSDAIVSLSYYCDKLHRIFVVSPWTAFDATLPPTGAGELYKPTFVK
jgi:hypothetical protein